MFLVEPVFFPLELLERSRNSLDLGLAFDERDGFFTEEEEGARCPVFFVSESAVCVPCSAVWVPRSAFRVPCSAFRVPCSAFRVLRSAFRVPRSVFCVLRSVFRVLRSIL